MIRVTRCSVLAGDVATLVDMQGVVNRVVCPHFDEVHQECRSKWSRSANGPLARLLEQAAKHKVAEHGTRCHLLSRRDAMSDARG